MATTNLTVPIVIGWKDIEARMAQRNIVEVVRCKDCGHSCKYNERWVAPKCDDVVWCRNDECSRDPEWFCAEGYRREL